VCETSQFFVHEMQAIYTHKNTAVCIHQI